MAFDFPADPVVGQIFTDAPTGIVYEWDGQAWMRKQDVPPEPPETSRKENDDD